MADRIFPGLAGDGSERYPDEGLDPSDDLQTDKEREAEADADERRRLHRQLCEWFKEAAAFGAKQREREERDKRFYRALEIEDQWPSEILRQRGVLENEDGTTPERPCLMIPVLKQPVRQVINEARNSRIAINLKHKGKASPEEAHLRQGLIRAIEADSNAGVAYIDALESAAIGGTGNFRVVTEYANDGDDDLDIVIEAIADNACVYWGPSFKKDKSDAHVVFIVDDLPTTEFQRKWDDVPLPKVRDGHPLGDYLNEWVSNTVVRVAEAYFVEMVEDRVADPQRPLMGRSRMRRTVRHVLMNADDILEEVPYPGRYLPVAFLPGERHVIRGEQVFKGVVADAIEAARLANYMYSAQAEFIGLTTKAPWILDPRQIAGFEKYWDEANTVDWPYLPIKRYVDGQDLGAPQRNIHEPPIQGITLGLQTALQAVQAITGRGAASLGQLDPNERSGKAIRELKVQGELGSSHFLNNLATITIPYAARVVNDLLFHVYNRPGRNARLLGDQPGEEEEILIGQAFTTGEDGRPRPVLPGAMGRMGHMAQQAGSFMASLAQRAVGRPPVPAPPPIKKYTLTQDGEYVVQASAGQSFETQRDENFAVVSDMIKGNPNLLPMLGDIMAKYMDGPMGQELAERFKMLNPMLAQAGNLEELPTEARAIVMQLQQQLQQAGMALQQAQQQIATDQAKTQGQFQIKQLEISAEMQTKQAELQVKFRTEMARIQADAAKTRATLASKEELERFDASVQQVLQAAEHAHEKDLERMKIEAEAFRARLAQEEADRNAARAVETAARDEVRETRAAVRDATLSERAAERAERRKADAARRATEFAVTRTTPRRE